MASTNTPQLSADEIDDILYLVRTNEAEELNQFLTELSQTHNCSTAAILESCVDQDNGNTPFHYCAANGFSDLFTTLQNHLDPSSPTTKQILNRKNLSGNSPLHWAALNGHVEVVKKLCDAGADVWVKNAAGNLPVFEAERAERDEVVAVLLLAGGKEVEEQLAAREGRAPEGEVEEGEGSASAAAAEGMEGVTHQMRDAGLQE